MASGGLILQVENTNEGALVSAYTAPLSVMESTREAMLRHFNPCLDGGQAPPKITVQGVQSDGLGHDGTLQAARKGLWATPAVFHVARLSDRDPLEQFDEAVREEEVPEEQAREYKSILEEWVDSVGNHELPRPLRLRTRDPLRYLPLDCHVPIWFVRLCNIRPGTFSGSIPAYPPVEDLDFLQLLVDTMAPQERYQIEAAHIIFEDDGESTWIQDNADDLVANCNQIH